MSLLQQILTTCQRYPRTYYLVKTYNFVIIIDLLSKQLAMSLESASFFEDCLVVHCSRNTLILQFEASSIDKDARIFFLIIQWCHKLINIKSKFLAKF